MSSQQEIIKQQVRQRYGQRAGQLARASSGCCQNFYTEEELAGLPPEVSLASLGNGNPLRWAELKPGEVVLDLGSGGGLDVILAARQVGAEGRAIGVDIAPEMQDLARNNARKAGMSNAEFRLGELEHLPVADKSVDVVISNCVINLSPDKDKVFAEAYRVLKPGGRLIVSDIVSEREVPDVLRQDLAAWASCFSGAITSEDHTSCLGKAGFTTITILESNPASTREGIPLRDVILRAYKPAKL